MELITSIKKMQLKADSLRKQNLKIALVPTMGFLHEGHLSLVKKAAEISDRVIVSIFVNPAQFGPNEDLADYPRDLDRDLSLLEAESVDYVFHPSINGIYPDPYLTYVETSQLTLFLCGRSRPGHFRGVTTIVSKLFNITKPHLAVFGQKDFQQARVIKKMTEDLNFDIKIIIAPIVRESDGLAMSSRNKYLSPAERKNALVLKKSLDLAKTLIKSGELSTAKIKAEMTTLVSSIPSTIDYIEIADADTLGSIEQVQDNTLIALAVKIGKTRLIDNFFIDQIAQEETWQ